MIISYIKMNYSNDKSFEDTDVCFKAPVNLNYKAYKYGIDYINTKTANIVLGISPGKKRSDESLKKIFEACLNKTTKPIQIFIGDPRPNYKALDKIYEDSNFHKKKTHMNRINGDITPLINQINRVISNNQFNNKISFMLNVRDNDMYKKQVNYDKYKKILDNLYKTDISFKNILDTSTERYLSNRTKLYEKNINLLKHDELFIGISNIYMNFKKNIDITNEIIEIGKEYALSEFAALLTRSSEFEDGILLIYDNP